MRFSGLYEIRWDLVHLMRFSEIWWDMVRFCEIRWDMVTLAWFVEILWDSMRFGEIQWDVMRFNEILQDVVVNMAAEQQFGTI